MLGGCPNELRRLPSSAHYYVSGYRGLAHIKELLILMPSLATEARSGCRKRTDIASLLVKSKGANSRATWHTVEECSDHEVKKISLDTAPHMMKNLSRRRSPIYDLLPGCLAIPNTMSDMAITGAIV